MTTDPRTLIEDPNLSREFKEQLLQAWAASREEDKSSWQPYFDEYGLGTRDRTPSADQRYAALLEDGSDAQTANASRLALGEHLRPDSFNDPEDMLDLGARGLEFFELFLPAARKLGYESLELTDYYARFDAERGMRLHALARDVDILGRSVDTARTELDDNEKCVTAVRTGWSGIAAAAAIDAAVRRNVESAATVDRLRDLAEVLFEANLTLSAAVTNKAYKVVSLHQPTVGGYSAAQIDVLAQIYAEGKDGDNSVAKDCMEDASYWFPELADDDYRHVNGLYKDGGAGALRRLDRDDVVRRAAGIAKDWLDANFRRVYEEKQQEFTAACADCADAVHAAYDAVVAEARSIEVRPAFRPEDTPEPAPAPSAPDMQNAGTVPAAAPGPAPAPTPAAPTGPAAAPANDGPAYLLPRPGGGDATTSPAAAAPPLAAPPLAVAPIGAAPPAFVAPPTATAPMTTAPTAPVGPVVPVMPGIPGSLVPAPGAVPGTGSLAGLGDLVRQSLAGGLADLGSILRPLIEDTLSGVTDRADEDVNPDHLGDERDNLRADEGEPGPGKSLELDLDGKSWTIAVDADGQGIHLEMSDGQGGTARFGVEIGPDGLPQILADNAAADGDPQGADCAPAESDSASHVEAGTEDPPATTTEDVPPPVGGAGDAVPDHEAVPAPVPAGDAATVPPPQVVTLQEEPAPAAPEAPAPPQEPRSAPELATGPVAGLDSGAELAEAGPL